MKANRSSRILSESNAASSAVTVKIWLVTLRYRISFWTRSRCCSVPHPDPEETGSQPADQFQDQYSGRESRRLAQAGVPVAIGGHGQQPGIAEHWEIWSHVRGGATPIEALRNATANPARIYGFRDIGTLEPGKLADLVILEANPLDDIQNTDNIAQVMLNGRLYDAATLNETVTGNRQRQPYFWEADGDGGAAAVARARANAESNGYDHD